ncbi:MAG TPA: class I SAM-dependent methyltransferase [Thermoplasmata archaeon]|nr:class I SAM-dependent methyltransferase [Thermoplasmata archaeon]
MRVYGLMSAMEAFVLGPEQFRAFRSMPAVEPMLLFPQEAEATSVLGRVFTHPSDIYAHLPTLYRITLEGPRPRVLELGTRSGESTLALLLAAKEIDGHVTSVDVNPCPEAESRVAEAGLAALWTFVMQGDLDLDWKDPIDHLFVDTSHRYGHTLEELRKYEPFVVSGGVISLHDTTAHPPVWRAVEEYFRGRKDVRIFRYYHNNGFTVIEKSGIPHG